jgi:hypothetical protein
LIAAVITECKQVRQSAEPRIYIALFGLEFLLEFKSQYRINEPPPSLCCLTMLELGNELAGAT